MKDDAQALGRVLDPAALDAATGPRARLSLAAPDAWLEEGGAIEIVAPAMLPCARCDGGGCDACGRAGALKTPVDATRRRVRATLPAGSRGGVALRITRPFADAAAIDQLIVEVRPGPASPGLTRVGGPLAAAREPPRVPPSSDARVIVLLMVAIAGSAALGLFLSR